MHFNGRWLISATLMTSQVVRKAVESKADLERRRWRGKWVTSSLTDPLKLYTLVTSYTQSFYECKIRIDACLYQTIVAK